MRIEPLNSLVLIEYQIEEEKQTKSGIYVPSTLEDNAFGFLRRAKVREVNPDCNRLQPGDYVLFDKRAAFPIPNSTELMLIRTEDIYAKANEDGPVATI